MSTEKLLEAATVLQEVDVSQIMSSMALSIAEAQQKLDDNSVNQLITLADATNGVNGKSLLELGFSPTFYHFQHADISASISLKMKAAESKELGISASIEYSSNVEKNNQIKSFFDQKDELAEKGEYKGHRKFIKNVNATSSTTIGKKSVKIDQNKGVYTKVNDLAQQVRESEQVDRLKLKTKGKDINLSLKEGSDNAFLRKTKEGFSTIYIPRPVKGGEGIFKMTNYGDATKVTYDNNKSTNEFSVAANFNDTHNAALLSVSTNNKSVEVIGFEKIANDKKGIRVLDNSRNQIELKHYFDYDRDNILFTYTKTEGGTTYDNNNTLRYFELLSKILKADPSAKIEIVGTTDRSGGDTTNQNLSERRAKAMKIWFESTGVSSAQIDIKGVGETWWTAKPDGVKDQSNRFVIVRFKSTGDYLYFTGTDFIAGKAEPSKKSAKPNKFLHLKEGNSKTGDIVLVFGKEKETILSANSASEIGLNISGNAKLESNKISAEYENAMVYMLHEESHLEFDVYSKDESNIDIKTSNTTNTSEDKKDTYVKQVNNNKFLSNLKESSKSRDSQRYFAIGGTFDYRTAKKHEIDVEGNASMSVRLVSLPAPAELLNEVKKALSKDS